MRQPLHLAQSAALLLRDRPGQELRLAVKLKYATATQKKMADANKLCDAFDRAALGHPTEVVFNAAVVLLANVIAHQSETFSEAEDATDKLGVMVCRMAHALMRQEANQEAGAGDRRAR